MMDNLTSIEPQSVAADKEPEADPDVSTYRVLRRYIQDDLIWHELECLTSRYVPTAGDVGEAYGEGDYLLIEKDGRYGLYSFLSTYEMRVVAEKRYRLADDGTA